MMGNPTANSIALLLLGSGLTFLAATFWFRKNQIIAERDKLAREHAALEARVREMEMQIGKVSSAITPISAAFQAILIKELTHFHTPEMDALMERLGPPVSLTADEELRLAELLTERSLDLSGLIPELERDAATMLPLIIKRVRAEHDLIVGAPNTELQVVSVVTDPSEVHIVSVVTDPAKQDDLPDQHQRADDPPQGQR